MSCPSREALARWLLGRLADAAADSVSAHVERCGSCQAVLQALDGIADPLVGELRGPAPAVCADPAPELERLLRGARALGLSLAAEATASYAGAAAPDGGPVPQQLREYRLLEPLGRGGMGRVYKALHTKLNRLVALKVLRAERMKHPEAVNRFQREMHAIGRLDHPHLVRATDAGEVNGHHFLVMELVDGVDVARLIAGGQTLPVAEACAIARQTALALHYVHEHGLVHRDVKPSNLMLTRDGQVKLLDLGLALLHEGEASGERLTDSGCVVGTVDYIAPEQITFASCVDIRADVYSLGCTLYRLLTGRVPFPEGTVFQKLDAHKHRQPVAPAARRPEIPQPLQEVLTTMLAKRPENRYQTPGHAADVLAPFSREA